MSTDNRLSPRLEILGYVPGEITVLAPIAIRDLGPHGAQVESSFPLLLNSIHELRLHLAGDSLVVRGRVAHCRVADIGSDVALYRAGIEFIDVAPHVAQAIADHLEHLRQLRNPS
ncbi:MAG: PilZ domain-containing protein [Vicinamibacterales bacterium]|nr:PilZ domain-containing protein [Vicinamibacterales bacterium]